MAKLAAALRMSNCRSRPFRFGHFRRTSRFGISIGISVGIYKTKNDSINMGTVGINLRVHFLYSSRC